MKKHGLLICPNCGEKLNIDNGCYKCKTGHSFDLAKEGYVNLLLSNQKTAADPGDNKAMIASRRLVMKSGYCSPLFSALAKELKDRGISPLSIVDAGCGEGFFAGSFAETFPAAKVVGVDISKHAAALAAKSYKGATFVVGSSKNLPIANSSADVVFCAFAPLFTNEILRVLKPNGHFIHIIPNDKHLLNLKSALYDDVILNDVPPAELNGLALDFELSVEYPFSAENDVLDALIKMTPYYYRTDPQRIRTVTERGMLTADLHFIVRVYAKQ